MIVMKFGGTSLGDAQRICEVIDIVTGYPGKKIIVLSAMSGTTNLLMDIAQNVVLKDMGSAMTGLDALYQNYVSVLDELFTERQYISQGMDMLDQQFMKLKTWIEDSGEDGLTQRIVSIGECLSTHLFLLKCSAQDIEAALLPALSFMRTKADHEPDMERISRDIEVTMDEVGAHEILITQGYICRDHRGEISNLQRGGSDYTATIVGAVLGAEEVQIWTDIDGLRSNDPRVVQDTLPIRYLSYREAAELAYFGAKILHPTCVLPAEKAKVPLRLKYTMRPDAPGTLIGEQTSRREITAIAAKDKITAIKIYSHRMLNAHGFLRKVFQVFENHCTSVDMITTSEVAVSLTIDNTSTLPAIRQDLSQYAEVEVEGDFSIICIVGNALYADGYYVKTIFQALSKIPCRMVSMGGSRYNISVLVKSERKNEALLALNCLFSKEIVCA